MKPVSGYAVTLQFPFKSTPIGYVKDSAEYLAINYTTQRTSSSTIKFQTHNQQSGTYIYIYKQPIVLHILHNYMRLAVNTCMVFCGTIYISLDRLLQHVTTINYALAYYR